jgi:hypothetical protein
MRVLEAGDWSLLLPDEWFAEQEDESILIGDRDGVGCLQLTELRRGEGASVPTDEAGLRELLTPEVEWEVARCGSFSGWRGALVEDGTALREWVVSCGEALLLITYSCDESNAGLDDSAVDDMLDTLRFAAADS